MIDAVLTKSFYQRIRAMALGPCVVMACVCLSVGLYQAFYGSPIDYQQKETVRIMYVHVPAAWLSLMIYAFMGLCALGGFVWRHSLAFVYARAAAPIGLVFTLIALMTGAIWGKPMWGTWWVWDARLTSMLVLAFLYGGYILFMQAFGDQESAARRGAILLMIGVVNLPVIKYSVEWWSTLHQPASVFKQGGPSIHASMLWPLALCFGGFLLGSFALGLLRMDTLLARQKLKRLRMLKARQEAVT